MGIPFGFYQGNRSEYLAIPALSKLGFTVPVPRQEDHFGIDFLIHLAELADRTVTPTGKSFGIQIKSDRKPLTFQKQTARDCLFGSSLPFFLGVVSKENLTLTIYNTLKRLCFFWMRGSEPEFKLVFDNPPDWRKGGVPRPDFERGIVWTGNPILEISISEPSTFSAKKEEIETFQSTMQSWIDLENQALSLKEQEIPLVYWPIEYGTNVPLRVPPSGMKGFSLTLFASEGSFPNICRTTDKTLMSLEFYLDKLRQDSSVNNEGPIRQLELMLTQVKELRQNCQKMEKGLV